MASRGEDKWSCWGISVSGERYSPRLCSTDSRDDLASELEGGNVNLCSSSNCRTWKESGSTCRGCASSRTRSGGGTGPLQPPSHKARHCPNGPTVGENRRTPSHTLSHSASARRERQAATLNVVVMCPCVTFNAWSLTPRKYQGTQNQEVLTISPVIFQVPGYLSS